jgi:hypothetical protein
LHEYGIAHGAEVFDTHNEERNVAMRALNAALGYQIVGGQYRYRRDPKGKPIFPKFIGKIAVSKNF